MPMHPYQLEKLRNPWLHVRMHCRHEGRQLLHEMVENCVLAGRESGQIYGHKDLDLLRHCRWNSALEPREGGCIKMSSSVGTIRGSSGAHVSPRAVKMYTNAAISRW